MPDTLFSTITLNGKPLNQCELALECNNTNCRLYVDRSPDTRSFYAVAVTFASCTSGGDHWACPDLEVEPLFNLTAYYDGVRHLEFNREDREMAGYIYYPNMLALSEMFAKIREIELEVCGANNLS